MARTKPTDEPSMGPIMAWNLYRHGYAEIVVRASELAEKVREKTGKPMTRQRISALMNSHRVEPATIATIAEAIGIEPAELTRKP